MTPKTRSIAMTVLLAASAAAGGAVLSANYVVSLRQAEGSLHEMVHRDLTLSPEQNRRLEVVEVRFAVRRQARETELREANRALAAAIVQSGRDSPAVQDAVDRIHASMGAFQKETIAHMFEMRAILNTRQAARFDREVVKALTEEDQ